MYISKIQMKNFRLLNDVTLELDRKKKKNLALLIGRNNSGKTSFIMLFDKFFRNSHVKFTYDDFSIKLRERILSIAESTDVNELAIKLILTINYTAEDSLENLSDFILDLDPDKKIVKILFECSIDKKRLLNDLISIENRRKYIIKNLSNYLVTAIYVFDNDTDYESANRSKLINKDFKLIQNLINFQVIHAKRDVASSESSSQDRKVLSSLTTQYFNKENKSNFEEFNEINETITQMDATLDAKYMTYFDEFLKNSKEFLNIENIKVVSDLQSKEIISNFSKIVYGSEDNFLPEHLNGLGFMNILYLLLKLEIKKNYFKSDKRDINLLFIEEPEAHTHPQMQYVFANKIKKILEEIDGLQTIITTHSSHIVSQCDFEDIRYFKTHTDNIIIKNFYNDLKEKYAGEEDYFKFIKQYLTINSSELFFAKKIIFIEGTSEKLLMPYFLKVFDNENSGQESYIKLSSQNISILEVGANAKAFNHFLEFLEIKTLIITDIDSTKDEIKKNDKGKDVIVYKACEVETSNNTSNYTLKYFLNAPKRKNEDEFNQWFSQLKANTLQDGEGTIKLAYQTLEKGYQARSFEDAFINVNIDTIKTNRSAINGLKKKSSLDSETNIYTLTKTILKEDGKSDFASSVLFLALSKEVNWEVPSYIKEGLKWIAQ